MNKKIFIILTNGFELIEAMAPVDILRRAGLDVVTVSTLENSLEVESAQSVKVIADTNFSQIDMETGDMVIIPGGSPGYITLGKDERVVEMVKKYLNENKYVGSICGGPTVLGKNGLIGDYTFTCHSAVKEAMGSSKYENKDVVIDRNLITSQGAGTSLEFGMALASVFITKEEIDKIKKGMELA